MMLDHRNPPSNKVQGARCRAKLAMLEDFPDIDWNAMPKFQLLDGFADAIE